MSDFTPQSLSNYPKGQWPDIRLVERLIQVIEHDIIPLTRSAIKEGNKVFGAAMLRKSDLSLIISGTNKETENPLWHGEISTINAYFEMVNADETKRVEPRDIVFVSTHEPCTLCASAITWCGFDNFYYLFSHEESRDAFQIGHDLKILKELYGHEPGGYHRQNAYWTARNLADLVSELQPPIKTELETRLDAIRATYDEMSSVYQSKKTQSKNIALR